jgi:hypothetical protein
MYFEKKGTLRHSLAGRSLDRVMVAEPAIQKCHINFTSRK